MNVTAPSQNKYSELVILLRAANDGDAACYQKFLSDVSIILRRVVVRKLPANDVEDVLQDILISIHKARHTYDCERPLFPWLLTIARFRINDHLRKLYANARHELLDPDAMPGISSDVTETIEDAEYIEKLLDCVPERERKILKMMHGDGYTAKETGTHLGMNESAVKVAAHRAMKKIRMRFGT
ncbi:MAG: sigma-70 family RNA polymerase sigma factor [Pseudomonadota bacterium]